MVINKLFICRNDKIQTHFIVMSSLPPAKRRKTQRQSLSSSSSSHPEPDKKTFAFYGIVSETDINHLLQIPGPFGFSLTDCCFVTTKAILQVKQLILKGSVNYLSFDNTYLEDGAENICDVIPRCPNLTDLRLSHTRLPLHRVSSLIANLPQTNVQTLDLTANCLRSNLLGQLITALPTTRIQSLNVSHNLLGAKDAKTIASALLSNPQLHTLALADNHIGDVGAKYIGQALPQSQLKVLNIARNAITMNGKKDFAPGLRHSGLHTLIIDSGDHIEDFSPILEVLPDTLLHTLGNISYTLLHTLGNISKEIWELGSLKCIPALESSFVQTLYDDDEKVIDISFNTNRSESIQDILEPHFPTVLKHLIMQYTHHF
jgi:hypothetical protein